MQVFTNNDSIFWSCDSPTSTNKRGSYINIEIYRYLFSKSSQYNCNATIYLITMQASSENEDSKLLK